MKTWPLLLLVLVAGCGLFARPAPDIRATLTRAQIDAVPGPLILVALDDLGLAAGFTLTSRNEDALTWSSQTLQSITFRDGIVISTRGLGFDVMNTDAAGSAAAARGNPPAEVYPRFHTTLDGEGQVQYHTQQCQVIDRAPETITIYERAYDTLRTTERCFSPGFAVENLYWLGRDGTMWKTRQWLGSQLGNMTVERLK